MKTARCTLWLCFMASVFLIGWVFQSKRFIEWAVWHIDPEEMETKSWTKY